MPTLQMAKAPSMEAITKKIRGRVGFGRDRAVVFKSDFDPQKHVLGPYAALNTSRPLKVKVKTVIIQGLDGNCEQIACKDYMRRIWDTTGRFILEFMERVLLEYKSSEEFIDTLGRTTFKFWTDPDTKCLSLEVAGSSGTIVAAGECFAFLAIALREASTCTGHDCAEPEIHFRSKKSQEKFMATIKATYKTLPPRTTSGGCWQDLVFYPSVFVIGFPMQRRRRSQGAGLEVSLPFMVSELETDSDGIIPTGYDIQWISFDARTSTHHWRLLKTGRIKLGTKPNSKRTRGAKEASHNIIL